MRSSGSNGTSARPGIYLPAIKADLLGRLGRTGEAAVACRQALALAADDAGRAFLEARLAEPPSRP